MNGPGLLFLVLVVGALLALWIGELRSGAESLEEILRARYARGEIGEQQLLDLLAALRGPGRVQDRAGDLDQGTPRTPRKRGKTA
ncbi:MAG: hypothetical protein KDD11_10355 [Acidobacteria bacterium]|nr:hypothetical protein [Acidobacteriota bacterium]